MTAPHFPVEPGALLQGEGVVRPQLLVCLCGQRAPPLHTSSKELLPEAESVFPGGSLEEEVRAVKRGNCLWSKVLIAV